MIIVYFESSSHAEVVAVFDTETTYYKCLPALEKQAKASGMVVTESVVDELTIEELYSKIKSTLNQ